MTGRLNSVTVAGAKSFTKSVVVIWPDSRASKSIYCLFHTCHSLVSWCKESTQIILGYSYRGITAIKMPCNTNITVYVAVLVDVAVIVVSNTVS